jgi:cell division protein FtsI/penicillin-binding protein 2
MGQPPVGPSPIVPLPAAGPVQASFQPAQYQPTPFQPAQPPQQLPHPSELPAAPVQQPPVSQPGQAREKPAAGGAKKSGAKKSSGRSKPVRLISIAVAAVIVLVIGITGVGPSGPPVTASVKQFLLDWQDQDYTDAAAMTTGNPAQVVHTLRSVSSQLGAQDLELGMGAISVRADHARAHFFASFDLGRGGLSWSYTGSFTLRHGASGWRIVWSPSVVVPGLGPGDRLAVLTSLPSRAVLLDQQGSSLIPKSLAIEVGVVPRKIKDPLRTAQKLAGVVGLAQSDAVEMSSDIQASTPGKFLELVQLTPAKYTRLKHRLHKIRDLVVFGRDKRLFSSSVPVITGTVATETAKTLVDEGEPYRPGTTIGQSQLEEAFQAKLAGKPTTEVVVQNKAGKWLKVLYKWPGSPASDVRTTISGPVQRAAASALSGVNLSAAIIAVKAGTGQILAVSRYTRHGTPEVSPLDGQYQPGQAFTIVSAAALLAATPVTEQTRLKCYPQNPVGGQPFSNVPRGPKLGSPTFAEVFAHACTTEFAVLSLRLNAGELTSTARQFGIGGVPWKLPIPAVAGQMTNPGSSQGELASDMTGAGSVAVSPLDMALIAGAVQSGVWQAPRIVSGQAQQSARLKLNAQVLTQLRGLMRLTVTAGAAKAAYRRGSPLYGQVGSAPLPGHHGLRAIWFVGYRGKVAFTVLVFAKSTAFTPAVQIASQFAAGLPGS